MLTQFTAALLALVLLAVATYFRHLYEAWIGLPTLLVGLSACGCCVIFTPWMAFALKAHAQRQLFIGYYFVILLLFVELAAAISALVWFYALGALPSETLRALLQDRGAVETLGSSLDRLITELLDTPLSVAQGLLCKTYDTCCRDPDLLTEPASSSTAGGNLSTCLAPSEDGALYSLQVSLALRFLRFLRFLHTSALAPGSTELPC